MRDYSSISLADARRDYLATSTTAMPIGGFIAWSALAITAFLLGSQLPSFAPFIAAAIPFPFSIGPDHRQNARRAWASIGKPAQPRDAAFYAIHHGSWATYTVCDYCRASG
jgi:hypothetical protein